MTEDEPPFLTDAALAASEEALVAAHRTVFDALDEAFAVIEMIYDDEGVPVDYRFLDVNHAFQNQTGMSDVRGRTVREVVPEIEQRWIDTYGQVARSRIPIRFVDEAAPMRRWFDVYAWPLGQPESHHVAIHFKDVTERKDAEEQLLYRSKQFHTLVQQAPIGVYLIDNDFRIAEVNPTAAKVFGDDEDLIGRDYGEAVRSLWPKELADKLVEVARRTLLTGVAHYEPEMAAVHDERGITEYYDWRMDRIHLPDGLDGIVCYFSDVSMQVAARRELTASESRYRTLFDSIDEGFCIVEMIFDKHERPVDYLHTEINPAFERHTGLEGALGRTARELLPDMEQHWFDTLGNVSLTGEPSRFVEHAQALGRWFDVYAFRVGEPDEGKVAVLFINITERKTAELALQENVALLRHHAHHDELTGLPNRLQFEERLREAVASADRHGRPFAVLFLDLDGFKAVNDDLGHASGDAVLIEVGRRLRHALRVSDMVARLHGDEFIFIIPEMSEPHEARTLAQKLCAAVRVPIHVAGTTVRVEASIGGAFYPNEGADPRALLRTADRAMYQAKPGGESTDGYVIAPTDKGDG